jgi:hypothetical protein
MAKLKIEIPEERVKASFKIKMSSHKILEEYSKYLSDLHKSPVSKDVIVESLLEKLSKDKEFKEKMKIKN